MTTLGRMFEEEKQAAIREAEERAKQNQDAERVSSIKGIMDAFNVTAEKAMEAIHLPEAERAKYLTML